LEEAREHLGVETQRQWSELAIERTTPVLLGLFSLVVLLAHRLTEGQALPVRSAAWYTKSEATFADALAVVRRHLWSTVKFPNSAEQSCSNSERRIARSCRYLVLRCMKGAKTVRKARPRRA
jgi:hypothetical protein